MALKKAQAKEYAKTLYISENLHQKVIAERVGVTEKTLGKWIIEGGWKKMKVSLLVTKENQITALYNQLEALNTDIATRPIIYDIPTYLLKPVKLKDREGNEVLEQPTYDPKDFPIKIGNTPTSKEADIISKIASAIDKLETETSVGETIAVAKRFISFVQMDDLDFAKKATCYFDAFIQTIIK